MELTSVHLDLLRVVGELEEPDRWPGTKAVGEGIRARLKERGGVQVWQTDAPWHGVDPYASELDAAGLLEVSVGIAKYRRWDQPIEPTQEYWLGPTAAGRQALADAELARAGQS
jgi:hypothetical protein